MPEGIIAVDNGDGFVTLDFVDQSLRGPALAALIADGGPSIVETITRKGPRRQYRVPVGNATDAGLVDEDTVAGPGPSAGYDTGSAAALVAADPNVNPGGDAANWHTPVAEYTSANKFVGQVPNATVLHNRNQVHTGDASSYGGLAKAPTHAEVIEHVKDNSNTNAVGGRAAGATVVQPQALRSVASINAALAGQDSALGTDPGARPDAGGEVIAEDYTSPEASREGQGVKSPDELSGIGALTGTVTPPDEPVTGDPGSQPSTDPTPLEPATPPASTPTPAPATTEAVQAYPNGTPSTEWKRTELDAYANAVKGIDTSSLDNKADALAAINAAT